MLKNPEFSFIIPIYNEVEVLQMLIERIDSLIKRINGLCEVVIVDDGSTDNTSFLLEELALKDEKYQCVFLSRNFGHQRALTAGLELARGEYIMILDADLQDPPELFFDFFEKIKEGNDVVYGIRKNRKESFIKRFFYNAFYRLLNKISNYPIPKDSGDFCLMTRRVVRAMMRNQEESRFLRGIRSWVGFKQIGIPYERNKRAAGITKYSFRKLFQLAYDGIFNFTTFPIKMLTISGVICILTSFLYFLITVIRKYVYDDVPQGFTAILFVVILFGGVQLLSLGVIGEYIQRIFFQVKKRPLYIISKKIIDGKEVYE